MGIFKKKKITETEYVEVLKIWVVATDIFLSVKAYMLTAHKHGRYSMTLLMDDGSTLVEEVGVIKRHGVIRKIKYKSSVTGGLADEYFVLPSSEPNILQLWNKKDEAPWGTAHEITEEEFSKLK